MPDRISVLGQIADMHSAAGHLPGKCLPGKIEYEDLRVEAVTYTHRQRLWNVDRHAQDIVAHDRERAQRSCLCPSSIRCSLVVFLFTFDGGERHDDVLLAHVKKSADPNHEPCDLAGLIDQDVVDTADLRLVRIIDVLCSSQ